MNFKKVFKILFLFDRGPTPTSDWGHAGGTHLNPQSLGKYGYFVDKGPGGPGAGAEPRLCDSLKKLFKNSFLFDGDRLDPP